MSGPAAFVKQVEGCPRQQARVFVMLNAHQEVINTIIPCCRSTLPLASRTALLHSLPKWMAGAAEVCQT